MRRHLIKNWRCTNGETHLKLEYQCDTLKTGWVNTQIGGNFMNTQTNGLKYPLDIQLFAEDLPADDPAATVTPEIDYDKLAETIDKRTSASEVSALKGILKEQGLSKEEMDEAVKVYKASKQSKAKEEQERIDKIIKENNSYKLKELEQSVSKEAQTIAKELGVRDDRFGKLMALCDRSKFTDDKGVIDKEAIKKEFEEQLKDVPEFKSKKQVVITKGKGSDVPPTMTDDEEYRRKKYGKNKYYNG